MDAEQMHHFFRDKIKSRTKMKVGDKKFLIFITLFFLFIILVLSIGFNRWKIEHDIRSLNNIEGLVDESVLRSHGYTINISEVQNRPITRIEEFFKANIHSPRTLKLYGRFPEVEINDQIEKDVLFAKLIFVNPNKDKKLTSYTWIFDNEGTLVRGINPNRKYGGAMHMQFDGIGGFYLIPEQTRPDEDVNTSDFELLYQYKIN